MPQVNTLGKPNPIIFQLVATVNTMLQKFCVTHAQSKVIKTVQKCFNVTKLNHRPTAMFVLSKRQFWSLMTCS